MIGLHKNFLKGNTDKCHLSTSSKTPVKIEVSNITVVSEEKVKLLGVYIDKGLDSDYHISELYKRAGKKWHALTFKYINISQLKLRI